MTGAREALRPGDVLAVRTAGLAGKLIRIGEELSGKPGLENHVALFHHWDGDVPWGLEGKPGGVGWADLRAYLGSAYTLNNCLQPGRDDAGRVQVAAEAERMLGTAYDWQAIADDTLRAFHMADLFASTWHGVVPGMTVCSSYAAFLYERQGWERPQVPDRDTEPGDWTAWIMERRWSATIDALRLKLEKAGCPVVNVTEELIWELQDQVQRGNQMLARLCEKAGIDPAEAARLPGEAPEPVKAA